MPSEGLITCRDSVPTARRCKQSARPGEVRAENHCSVSESVASLSTISPRLTSVTINLSGGGCSNAYRSLKKHHTPASFYNTMRDDIGLMSGKDVGDNVFKAS